MDNKAVVDEVCKRVTALVVALEIAVVGAVLVIEAFTLQYGSMYAPLSEG
jgi:hypothetical protein